MSLRFTEEEFQDAWKELDEPQLEGGWEFFTETMGVKIYRLYDKETGLYEYKVFGVLTTCTPELCADVYMDLAYRKQWDGYVKELYERDFDGHAAIYWESKPQYVYVRERRDLSVEGRKISVVLAKSSPATPCAEKSGVLRVKDYKQSLAMETDGGCGTKVFMNYFDNPGGNIPTWLVNWAAKTGVPSFLTDMQKACSGYSNYCQKK
ncbi:phosphatidylcholine transfer protein isoform 2-T2 [Polymixia lowei]